MSTEHLKTGTRESIEVRRRQAIDLRLKGASYQAIADQLHCSRATVCGDMKVMLARLHDEQSTDTEKYRALELNRLDMLWQPMFLQALEGKTRAAEIALSISERRSKLLGLDQPVKAELAISLPPELVAYLASKNIKPSELFLQIMQSVQELEAGNLDDQSYEYPDQDEPPKQIDPPKPRFETEGDG